ncbi:LysR family transcriptional regulator [Lachnospiraceae bacterium 54-53]
MEISQLKYFLYVAKFENMSQAAQYLHISQPSISRAIQSLEEELHVELLRRNGKRLSLTYEGQLFQSRLRPLMDEMDRLSKEMSILGRQSLDMIKINALSAENILKDIIAKFKEENPNVFFKISCKREDTDWDLCIRSTLPEIGYHTDADRILEEQICLAMPDTSWLAGKDIITLEDLKNEKFILLSRGLSLRDIADKRFQEMNFIPNQVFECDRGYMVRSLIQKGLGVTLWPRLSWNRIGPNEHIVLKPLDLPDMYRSIYLLRQRDRQLTKTAERFRDFLLACFKEKNYSKTE